MYALGLDFEKVRLVPCFSLWLAIFQAEEFSHPCTGVGV
jgi:hypothetical protein